MKMQSVGQNIEFFYVTPVGTLVSTKTHRPEIF